MKIAEILEATQEAALRTVSAVKPGGWTPEEPNRFQPYIGPRPFRRSENDRFFGRDREIADLAALLIAQGEVLLYSQSGAGKTSLVNAGLIPLLEQQGFDVLPPVRVQGVRPTEERPQTNIYAFNVISHWENKYKIGVDPAQTTISVYLDRMPQIRNSEEEPQPRVLIFDQFEEVFTCFPERWKERKGLFRQIGEACQGTPALLKPENLIDPVALTVAICRRETPLTAYLADLMTEEAREALGGSIPALCRELNRILQDGTLVARRNSKEAPFAEPIRAAIEEERRNLDPARLGRRALHLAFPDWISPARAGDPSLRVLFSMREEAIAQLEPYTYLLAGKWRTRMRLERLRESQALLAVTDPLKNTGYEYAPEVAEKLVAELLTSTVEDLTIAVANEPVIPPEWVWLARLLRPRALPPSVREVQGEFVEPVYLQVVCDTLWSKLPRGERVITMKLLDSYGDVDQALTAYYEAAVRAAVQTAHCSERKVRTWCERYLITPARTRGTIYRGLNSTAGVSDAVVKVLEEKHIIRSETRAGARWCELTHDRLIDPILSSNQAERERRGKRNRAWGYGVLTILVLILALTQLFRRTESVSTVRPPLATAAADKGYEEANTLITTVTNATAPGKPAAKANVLLACDAVDKAREVEKQTEGPLTKAAIQALAQAIAPFKKLRPQPAIFKTLNLSDTIACVALSSDGYTVATGSKQGRVYLWDTRNNQPPRQLSKHAGTVNVVAFSADGKLVASASNDSYIFVTQVLSGAPQNIFQHHNVSGAPRGVRTIAFHPTRPLLASGGFDRVLRLWNLEKSSDAEVSHQNFATLMKDAPKDWQRSPVAMNFDPSGHLLAVAAGRAAWLLEGATMQRARLSIKGKKPKQANATPIYIRPLFEPNNNTMLSVALSPDGARLVTSSKDGISRVWDVQNESVLIRFDQNKHIFESALSKDGRYLATASADGGLEIRDMNSVNGSEVVSKLPPNGKKEDRITHIALSPDGRYLATAFQNGKAAVWLWRPEDQIAEIRRLINGMSSL